MLDIKPKENKEEKKVETKVEEPPVVESVPEVAPTNEVLPPESKESALEKDQTKLNQLRKIRQRRIRRIVLILLGATIFFFLTTMYSQYQVYILKKLEAANALAHPEVPTTPNQIVEAVSRHIVLPDSVPQIAAVQDAKKLSTSQTFFKNAVNGDVVLVYDTTIILYRPAQDIIVAVGDVTAGGVAK